MRWPWPVPGLRMKGQVQRGQHHQSSGFHAGSWCHRLRCYTAAPGWLLSHPSPPSPTRRGQEGVPPEGRAVLQRPTSELSGHVWRSWERQGSRPRASPSCPVALSPTCGCQLDGAGERRQLLSSHSQWSRVSAGAGVGSDSSDSSQLVIAVLLSQTAKVTHSRCWPGPWRTSGTLFSGSETMWVGAELTRTAENHQPLSSFKRRRL